jgi:hypothetical protein
MIEPEQLVPGRVVSLGERSGVQWRHGHTVSRLLVRAVRPTTRPELRRVYIWLTGVEIDQRGNALRILDWTFLSLDGIAAEPPWSGRHEAAPSGAGPPGSSSPR